MGRFSRGNVFSESSKQEITADKAMSIAQFNHRITMELSPKLLLRKGPPLKREAPSGEVEKPGNKNKMVGKDGGEGKSPESGTPQPEKQYYG